MSGKLARRSSGLKYLLTMFWASMGVPLESLLVVEWGFGGDIEETLGGHDASGAAVGRSWN